MHYFEPAADDIYRSPIVFKGNSHYQADTCQTISLNDAITRGRGARDQKVCLSKLTRAATCNYSDQTFDIEDTCRIKWVVRGTCGIEIEETSRSTGRSHVNDEGNSEVMIAIPRRKYQIRVFESPCVLLVGPGGVKTSTLRAINTG